MVLHVKLLTYIGLKDIKETILLSSYSHAFLQNEDHCLDLGFLKIKYTSVTLCNEN